MLFGKGEISTSEENKVFFSDEKLQNVDFLCFFDSRMMTINEDDYSNTVLYKLKEILDQKNYSYIMISRPKNLTTFATLYNFIQLNENLNFKYLVTNLGFVDFTPKKEENLKDILLQIGQFSTTKNNIVTHENYELSNGKCEALSSVEYGIEYFTLMVNLLKENFEKLYFLNTPLVSKNIQIERKRPDSFFHQLDATNEFIEKLVQTSSNKSFLIDIKEFGCTYDGAHFTQEGHLKVLKKIKESIKL